MADLTDEILAQANVLDAEIAVLQVQITGLNEYRTAVVAIPTTRFTISLDFIHFEEHRIRDRVSISGSAATKTLLLSTIDSWIADITTRKAAKEVEFAALCGS